jgi:hypothetical protein
LFFIFISTLFPISSKLPAAVTTEFSCLLISSLTVLNLFLLSLQD